MAHSSAEPQIHDGSNASAKLKSRKTAASCSSNLGDMKLVNNVVHNNLYQKATGQPSTQDVDLAVSEQQDINHDGRNSRAVNRGE